MKVTVKLYGTLSAGVPGYHHLQGIEIDLSDGAAVEDLLACLDIAKSQRAVVAVDGRIQKPNHKIPGGAHVQIFQPVHGG